MSNVSAPAMYPNLPAYNPYASAESRNSHWESVYPNLNGADNDASTLNFNPSAPPLPSDEAAAVPSSIPMPFPMPQAQNQTVKRGLKDRIITLLSNAEARLDKFVPNSKFQTNFDTLCQHIQAESKGTKKFNEWLKDNGHGAWYTQLATFLAKLPIKAATNILRLICSAIKLAIGIPAYVLIHPLKTPLKLVKILVELVHALLQPETWIKIGGGLIGSSLGAAAISGGPLGVITFGIGAAMIIGGLSVGTLKTILMAEKGLKWTETKAFLHKQIKQIPEDIFTGFCMVMLLEGIQQVIRGFQKLAREIKYANDKSASKKVYSNVEVEKFYQSTHFPHHDRIKYNNTDVSISWHNETFIRARLPIEDADGVRFFRETVHTHDEYVTSWVYNHTTEQTDTIITTIPIYEDFYGYRIAIPDWIPPVKPPLAAAIRLSDKIVPNLGLGVSLDVLPPTSKNNEEAA